MFEYFAADASLAKFDSEEWGVARHIASIATRVERVSTLFASGLCWSCCYTQHAMEMLSSAWHIVVRGVPRRVGVDGGSYKAVAYRFINQLRAWASEARLMLSTELPSVDPLACFIAFDLQPL